MPCIQGAAPPLGACHPRCGTAGGHERRKPGRALHRRLRSTFRSAKSLPRDIGDGDLQEWTDNASRTAGIYAEPGCEFGGKLLGAASYLFTLARHPGMGPTSNRCGRSLGLVTFHKRMRPMLRSAGGMAAYGTLMTCMTAWNDQGADLTERIREAVAAG